MAAVSCAPPEYLPAPPPRLSREDERTIVWLGGEQDVVTVSLLVETLATAFSLDDAEIVVDLRDVSFIDAATVGVLIRGRNFLWQHSRELTIREPSRCARRILDLCGLDDLIDAPQA